jgi:hypothetical protein
MLELEIPENFSINLEKQPIIKIKIIIIIIIIIILTD